MLDIQLRELRAFLTEELCRPHGTDVKLEYTGDRTAEIVCQYEGYARILEGLLCRQKNIAELAKLGYSELRIKFGKQTIAIAEVFDLPESNQSREA